MQKVEAKPFSSEDRDDIERYLEKISAPMLQKAMAAEAYWREAVKHAAFRYSDGCPWCDRYSNSVEGHDAFCAWRLANEQS